MNMYESNMAIAALILFLNVISSTRQLHDVGIGLKKSVGRSMAKLLFLVTHWKYLMLLL